MEGKHNEAWVECSWQAGRQTGMYRGRQRGSLFNPLISPDWDNWMGLLEDCNRQIFEFLYYVSEQLLSGCCWDIKRFSANITKNASRITYKPDYWSGLKQLSYVPTWALKQTLLAVIIHTGRHSSIGLWDLNVDGGQNWQSSFCA